MATSQVLQTPEILEIIGSTIRVKHPDISNNFRTYLSAQIAAGGTTMTVYDTGAVTGNGLADNDWFIAGTVGDNETEENDVNGTVTRGTSITVTNALSFDHELDAPITKIFERGIKIYGAATDGGSGTIIESIDAKAGAGRQLADAVMIEWHRDFTEYTLISTDTSYAYYYATFTDGTTESGSSDYVLAAGLGSTSVEYMIRQALSLTNTNLKSNRISREDCIKWADDCQTAITQFVYQEPRSGKYIQKDWPFEEVLSSGDITMTTNKNKYALSGLSSLMKYDDRGVITVQMGTLKQFKKTDIDDMTIRLESKPYTEVATAASAGDTTLVVDSVVEFSDPDGASTATLYVNGQTLTYTDLSGTTTFTGIPASGTGSITASISVDDGVWQNNAPGLPEYYSIFNNQLILDKPPQSDYNNFPLNLRYFKKLTALTQASDTTEVSFSNVFQYFIASQIERRRQKHEEADRYMEIWRREVLNNAIHQKTASKQYQEYYKYNDPQNYYLNDYSTANTA
jgi:hypothetical protein